MCALCADLPLICPPSLDWAHLHKHKPAQTDICMLDIRLVCCKAASLPVCCSGLPGYLICVSMYPCVCRRKAHPLF